VADPSMAAIACFSAWATVVMQDRTRLPSTGPQKREYYTCGHHAILSAFLKKASLMFDRQFR